MANGKVFTRDSVSGQVAWVPATYLKIFPNLEEVPEGTKPLHPDLHAETDSDGKNAEGKQVRKPKEPVAEVGNPNEDDPKAPEPVN